MDVIVGEFDFPNDQVTNAWCCDRGHRCRERQLARAIAPGAPASPEVRFWWRRAVNRGGAERASSHDTKQDEDAARQPTRRRTAHLQQRQSHREQ